MLLFTLRSFLGATIVAGGDSDQRDWYVRRHAPVWPQLQRHQHRRNSLCGRHGHRDNAIVVLENIFRYREMGMIGMTAALEGTKEVWGAVLAATLVNLAVFAYCI